MTGKEGEPAHPQSWRKEAVEGAPRAPRKTEGRTVSSKALASKEGGNKGKGKTQPNRNPPPPAKEAAWVPRTLPPRPESMDMEWTEVVRGRGKRGGDGQKAQRDPLHLLRGTSPKEGQNPLQGESTPAKGGGQGAEKG